MELESYFDFIDDESIRIGGTRVSIEMILWDYQEGASPEEIVLRYPTLSLEQVHASITYYLANRNEVETYLKRIKHSREEAWQEQKRHPSKFVQLLRERVERERSTLRQREPQQASKVSG